MGSEAITSSDEIAWSFRKLLETSAADRPLICVFDDIHWGEETFLDLVESIADLSRGAPILLLCIARPELLDRRPGWAGGKLNSTSVLLEPLAAGDAEAMIASLAVLQDDLRVRIREAAEGNPLFVEQMVALVKESGSSDVTVPPTIQALLAARLEQLDDSERGVLERGAVEGRIFHRGAVEALAPEEGQVIRRISALVRKELVRPDKPEFVGEDAFRFRHLLIREAAYDALPKALRADLHERFAGWLQAHDAEVELAEVLGYHFEQACRYRRDLGREDETTADLAARAADCLGRAGRRASGRGDMPSAVNLLERAAALLPRADPSRARLLPILANALVDLGRWDEAGTVLDEAAEVARAQGLTGVLADAMVGRAFLKLHSDPAVTQAQTDDDLSEATRLFGEAGDQAGIARAMTLAGRLPYWGGQGELAIQRLTEAAAHARAAGDRALELDALIAVLAAMTDGPTPITMALDHARDTARLTTGMSRADIRLLTLRSDLELAVGNRDLALASSQNATRLANDLGQRMLLHGSIARSAGRIALATGDLVGADRVLAEACDALEEMGDSAHLVSMVPYLADARYALGRMESVAARIEHGLASLIAEDVDGQVGMRRALAKLHASRGDLAEAVRTLREALERVEPTDSLPLHAEVLRDLADLHVLAGRRTEAIETLETELALQERKGATGFADRARGRIASLLEQA